MSVEAVFQFTLDYAEKLLADVEDEQMTQLPHPGMNHAAWILGHVALGWDLIGKLCGQPLSTQEAWMRTYGPGSTVVADRAVYGSKQELLSVLRATHARAVELMRHATPEQLDAPNKTPFFPELLPTVGDLITHLMTTHAATHLGQLSAWRRCIGKPSVLGI